MIGMCYFEKLFIQQYEGHYKKKYILYDGIFVIFLF